MTPEELLKGVGEPVGYHYLPNNEMFPVEEVSRSNLKNNPQDYVFLYTSDQVAAAIAKATKPLEERICDLTACKWPDAYTVIPVKINGQLHATSQAINNEINSLRQQLAAAQLREKVLTDALNDVGRALDAKFYIGDFKAMKAIGEIVSEALATPASTEALDKYVAEKIKEYN